MAHPDATDVAPPFTVQLQASDGACFAAAYSPDDVKRSDGKRLRVVAKP